MATIIDLEQAQALPKGQMRDWAYNALDVTGTREVADVLLARLDTDTQRIYNFTLALMAPTLTMQMRGVLVDVNKRAKKIAALKRELKRDEKALAKHPKIVEVWDGTEKDTGKCKLSTRKDGKHSWERGVPDTPDRRCVSCGAPRYKPSPFNPNSPQQSWHLWHELLGVPKPMLRKKGGGYGVDKEVLLKIKEKMPKLTALADAALEIRNKKKQIGFLGAKLTATNRFPSTFNPGGAWTGRMSSNKDHHQRGANLQNIAERHRDIFIADPGYKLVYADYKQAESNTVAHLAGDEKYIEAHAIGDVHTYVTRLVWPELPWTWDIKKDKKIAKQNPEWDQAPGHEYRFQSKRIQHGSNYGLSPFGIAMIAHIPQAAAEQAQGNYYKAFPMIPAWQNWNGSQVKEQLPLYNPLGRRIMLFGRPWDGHTLKQGLAFQPQSTVADLVNIAMWRIWKELEPEGLQLLAQVHDALLFQYPEDREDLLYRALELMKIDIPIKGVDGKMRTMQIEVEAAVGRNWRHKSEDNPEGIEEIEI